MKELLKHFFIYGLGATVGKFLSLFLLPIYASVFTPEDYGTLDFIIALSAILGVFGMIQIETGLQRFYYEQPTQKEQERLISVAFIFTLICSLVISAIAIAFVPLISNYYFSSHFRLELLLAFLSILPNNLLVIVFVVLRFQKRSKIYLIISLTQVLLSSLSAIYAVKFLGYGIFGVLLTTTASSYLILILSLFILRSTVSFHFDYCKLKQMLSYAAPQFPARLGSISNVYINRFVMISMLSVAAIGLYSVSLRIASGMQLIYTAFQLAWYPFLYELIRKENHKIELVRIYKIVLVVLSYIIITSALFSKEVVLLLTNEQYIESYKLVAILTFYFALYMLKEIVDIGVVVTKKTKYTSYNYFVTAIVNIALLLLLTPFFKLYGVVYALLISNFVLFFLTLFVTLKLYPMKYPLWKSILVLVFTLFMASLPIFVELNFEYRLTFFIVLTIMISTLYYKKIRKLVIHYKYVK